MYPFWGMRPSKADSKLPRMLTKNQILVAFLTIFALLGPAAGAQARTLSGSEASLLQTMNAVRARAQWVVNTWLNSPTHRAVLLRPGFKRVGIGISYGTFAGHGGAGVVTADFAGR